MNTSIDQLGRVLIPKRLRDSMGLQPGTRFEVVETHDGLALKLPEREEPQLVRRGQFLVAVQRDDTIISEATILELRDAGRR